MLYAAIAAKRVKFHSSQPKGSLCIAGIVLQSTGLLGSNSAA
jgi:hypothetical protein